MGPAARPKCRSQCRSTRVRAWRASDRCRLVLRAGGGAPDPRGGASPYPDDLILVTKLGGARRDDGTWYADLSAWGLRLGCEHDLRLLGLDVVPVTHLRWDDEAGVPFENALETMLELQKEGKIRHLGLSNVSLGQLELAMTEAEIVTVSNGYSVTDRSDDAVVDRCTALAIPYLPYFPLAIGKVAEHSALLQAAEQLGVTPAQVALAWLLSRSPVSAADPGHSLAAAPGGERCRRRHIVAGRDAALVALLAVVSCLSHRSLIRQSGARRSDGRPW